MDKDDIYYLQLIDCNCNNCIYMERDLVKYEHYRIFHFDMQQEMFGRRKAKAINDAMALVATNPTEPAIIKAYDLLLKKAWEMKFMFEINKINYGDCNKLNKPVSFLPNTCQLETQECFKHRKSE